MLFQSCGLFQSPQKAKKDKEPQPKEEVTQKAEDSKELLDTASVDKTTKDSIEKIYPHVFKDTYEVALILPIFLDDDKRKSNSNEKISKVASEFYMGARMAWDTLANCSKHFKVHVYDNAKDSAKLDSILNTIEEKAIDLIIGPFYTNFVKQTSTFAKNHKINHLAPFAYVEESLSDNPYYLSVKPSPETYARKAAKVIHSRDEKPNVFLVRSYDQNERKIGYCLDTIIDSNKVASYEHLAIKDDQWNTAEIFKDTLKKKNNFLVIPSQDQVFTTSIIGNLKAVDTIEAWRDSLNHLPENLLEKEVTILGLRDWLDYESMEGKTMKRFNMHFMGEHYINYQKEATRNFVRKYRNKYHSEPSEFAFKGYDLSLLIGKMMANYGKYFERTWYDEITSLLHNDFHFKQVSGQKGWQNFHLRLLRYQDYKVKLIRD